MANAPDLSLRGCFAPMAISPARSGQCRGVACRARRRTCNLYKPPSKWQTLPTCHCEEQSDVAISPTRSGQCRGADSRARRRTCGPYRPPLKRHRPPICHCEEANGRRGNLGKAVAFSPMAFPRCDCVLRDCHVASLLAMTHQVVRRCTSALLPLNGSVQGAHRP